MSMLPLCRVFRTNSTVVMMVMADCQKRSVNVAMFGTTLCKVMLSCTMQADERMQVFVCQESCECGHCADGFGRTAQCACLTERALRERQRMDLCGLACVPEIFSNPTQESLDRVEHAKTDDVRGSVQNQAFPHSQHVCIGRSHHSVPVRVCNVDRKANGAATATVG